MRESGWAVIDSLSLKEALTNLTNPTGKAIAPPGQEG